MIRIRQVEIWEVASKLGLELHESGTEWHGPNPFDDGATEDGFILFSEGNAWDRKIARSYSAKEVRELAGFGDSFVRVNVNIRKPKPKPKKRRKKMDYTGWSRKEYVYTEGHIPRLKVVRLDPPPGVNERKQFLQMTMVDGKWQYGAENLNIFYNEWPCTRAPKIIIVEGEKCADAVNEYLINSPYKNEIAATTVPGGSGRSKRWVPLSRLQLYAKEIYIIPDNDEPGMRYAEEVFRIFKNRDSWGHWTRIIKLTGLEDKEDVYDWIQKGGDFGKIVELIQKK